MRRRLLVLPATLLLAATLGSCGGDDESSTASEGPAATPGATVTIPEGAETVECDYPGTGTPPAADAEPPPSEALAEGEIPVTLATSVGDLELTLDAAGTPCTAHSFASLAVQGYFDGTTCHRLVTQGIYVLQCGDPSASGSGGPGYSFADELTGEEDYSAGALAMANAGADTNGSQFFIVYGDSTGLPRDYTVFGSVDEDTVAAVEEVAAAGSTPEIDGTPNTPVDIDTATVGD